MNALDKLSYTTNTLADVTGIPVDTIRAAIRSGDLRVIKPVINGREIRKQMILAEDAAAWLKGGRSA